MTATRRHRIRERERVDGLRPHWVPIGNLTSQIFANIYLHELDRYIVHTLRPQAYLRYGDDFFLINASEQQLQEYRSLTQQFLRSRLHLELHRKNDILVAGKRGMKFLGVWLYPRGRRLTRRMRQRMARRLAPDNLASYRALVAQHESKRLRQFDWQILERCEEWEW